MSMGIDEPGHDPLSGSVDNVNIVSVFQLYIGGKAPRAFDAITLDHNGLIPCGRIPSAVNQGSVGDHDGLFTMGDHVNLLLWIKCRAVYSVNRPMHLLRPLSLLY